MRPSRIFLAVFFALLGLVAGMVRAQDGAPQTWTAPGLMGGGIKGNDAYVEGSLFLTWPFYSTIGRDGSAGGSIWLIEPYVSTGEGPETATSLGLAWRHLFSHQPIDAIALDSKSRSAGLLEEGIFVGANLFADLLDTQYDNLFWQLGGGLEFGTRYFEVRTNYYLPLSDPQEAEFTLRKEGPTRRVDTYYSDPYASGHGIEQDLHRGLFEITPYLERLFRVKESGMEGWDAEAAILVPWVDRWMDVRIIPGYYSFENQPFGPQSAGTGKTEGWKAGLEARPVPALALQATWYEDERFVGGDWTAGFRLEIPFEIGDAGDGKDFWGRIQHSLRPRRRHLAERLSEPVKRQNSAVKTTAEVEEVVSAMKVGRDIKVIRETKKPVNTTVLDDVIFLNGAGETGNGIGAGSPGGNGTAEKPFAYASDAVNRAMSLSRKTQRIWNVYAEGSVPGKEEDYDRQSYWGAFVKGPGKNVVSGFNLLGGAVPVQGGLQFGSGVRPYFSNVDAEGLSHLGVSGILVNSITAEEVGTVVIQDNIVGAPDVGRLWDYTMSLPRTGGVYSVYFSDGGFITLTAVGGSVRGYHEAAAIRLINPSNALVERNVIAGNWGHGILLTTAEFGYRSNVKAMIRDNVIMAGNGASGIYVSGFGGQGGEDVFRGKSGDSQMDVEIRNNRISAGFGGNGVRTESASYLGDSSVRVSILDNIISAGPEGNGIYAR